MPSVPVLNIVEVALMRVTFALNVLVPPQMLLVVVPNASETALANRDNGYAKERGFSKSVPAIAVWIEPALFPFRRPVSVVDPVPPNATESVDDAERMPLINCASPVPPVESVSAPAVSEPIVPMLEKRLVDDARVAKKFVEVAFTSVTFPLKVFEPAYVLFEYVFGIVVEPLT